MYYYYHAATGTSQWDYPTVMQQPLTAQPLQPAFPDYQYQTPHMALPTAEIQLMSTENEPSELERSGYATPPQPPPETTSTSTSMTLSATAASLVSPAHGFSRDPIPDKNSKSSRKRAGNSLVGINDINCVWGISYGLSIDKIWIQMGGGVKKLFFQNPKK